MKKCNKNYQILILSKNSFSAFETGLAILTATIYKSGRCESRTSSTLIRWSPWLIMITYDSSVLTLRLVLRLSCFDLTGSSPNPRHVERRIQTTRDVLCPVVEVQLTLYFPVLKLPPLTSWLPDPVASYFRL